MPHFVVDCSQNVLDRVSPSELVDTIHLSAENSALFDQGNVKVRIAPFEHYTTGGTQDDFVHIVADIMGGRTIDQKKKLADSVIRDLKPLLPNVKMLSIDIRDIEPLTYSNRHKV